MNLTITIIFCACVSLFLGLVIWKETKASNQFFAILAEIEEKVKDEDATREELLQLERQLVGEGGLIRSAFHPRHHEALSRVQNYLDGRLQGCK